VSDSILPVVESPSWLLEYTEDLERQLWENAGSESGRKALQSFYEFVSKIEAQQTPKPSPNPVKRNASSNE